MASAKILENKKAIVNEIQDLVKNSESVLVFTYQGLTVADLSDLRIKLHNDDSEVKIYKNGALEPVADTQKVGNTDKLVITKNENGVYEFTVPNVASGSTITFYTETSDTFGNTEINKQGQFL